MASIFRKDDNFVDKPNRNSFDMSFQNNLTTKFGVLKPVYCQEVIPGDSFTIRPDFALRFLPMVFPVQTRMRAHLHFFYVRNRTIWKDWMDFIGKTKEGLVPPYIQFTENNKKMLDVGNLADMFGVPVVLNSDIPITLKKEWPFNYSFYDIVNRQYTEKKIGINWQAYSEKSFVDFSRFDYRESVQNVDHTTFIPIYNSVRGQSSIKLKIVGGEAAVYTDVQACAVFRKLDGTYTAYCFEVTNQTTAEYTISFGSQMSDELIGIFANRQVDDRAAIKSVEYEKVSSAYDGIPISDLTLTNINKFFGANGETISALPFRAYEAIYNSFYRNAENNPYILNGVPEYNKYIPTYDGGADANYYEMHNRNWEDDFLTTAVQSPQQGNAPLVGLSATSQTSPIVVFGNDDGTRTELALSTGDDGEILAVENKFTARDEYANILANALRDGAVNFGMRINDLRDVNSFQRWLENNIRKGYKYRDQIKGHYGVTVRYDELSMPEFIGGVSRDVSVQQVTQTVKNEFGELGEFGGQSYVMGSGEPINQYCDEHGFIIGILSVVPMANYSQVISKYLLKKDALDYYFPEFGKIGMQPILNKEVTFLESIDEGKKDEVFGYQRAWYDYLARTDEVHGLFRTNLRRFLVGRTFDSLPELSASFSTIQNDQLNNIFYVDDGADKILGQIYFDVTAVRPIPVYGIPSLE